MNAEEHEVVRRELWEAAMYFVSLIVEIEAGEAMPGLNTAGVLVSVMARLAAHRNKRRELSESTRIIELIEPCVKLHHSAAWLARGLKEGQLTSGQPIDFGEVIVTNLLAHAQDRGYPITEEEARFIVEGKLRNKIKKDSVRERLADRIGQVLKPTLSQSAVRHRLNASKRAIPGRSALKNPEQFWRAFHNEVPSNVHILARMMRVFGYSWSQIIKALVAAGHSHMGLAVELGNWLPEARHWRHGCGVRRSFRRRRFATRRRRSDAT